jgi:serine/threonine-protein kinase
MSFSGKTADTTFLKLDGSDGEALADDGHDCTATGQATAIRSLISTGGERVLHYEVQAKLGEGGMGVVYKAVDQKLHRLVALKFLPAQAPHSNVDFERFLQEANALSALNHPHISTIYAVETSGEQQFLVLEYLPGGTLKAKLQKTYGSGGVLSIDDVLRYARQTAEGLAHAHSRGIVHRDVKTSNLMLSEEGDVKITDFGVAKLSGSSIATVPGSLMGTIAYMSPEQVLGMDVDARSDVFSFGVSLFELITGRLPFEAPNDAALITRVASARAPELKEFRSNVPANLELVVQTALKKRVEERYQTMDDLLSDLRAPAPPNLEHTQTRARTTVKKRVVPIPKRTLRIAGASILLIAAAIIGGLFPSLRQQFFGGFQLPGDKQLVVLRFRNTTGDPLFQPFCDGLTELITNQLTQLKPVEGSLVVVAPGDVLNLDVTSARKARDVLGANLVLDGSVARMRDRTIITFNLVETANQHILAGHRIEASTDSFDPQDSIFESVAEMLRVKVKPEARRALAAAQPGEPSAFGLYARGRGYLQRYDLVENLDKAMDVFQQALSRDPSYALAYAGLAEAYLRKYAATKKSELVFLAQDSGQRALQLNDSLAPVHYAMGLIHRTRGEYEQALQSFQRSINIHTDADAYRELANTYDDLHRTEEAQSTYRHAIEMHLTYWAGYRDLAAFYQRHGRFDEALPLYQQVVQLTPDSYAALGNLGGLYVQLKMLSKAIAYLERAISVKPTWGSYYNLGTVAYLQHRYTDAIAMYKKAIELTPTDARGWAALADTYRLVPQSTDQFRDTYAHAIGLIEKELTVNPSDARNKARIASWRVMTDKKRALKEISEALRLGPDDNFVQARAAVVYEQSRMREKALAAVKLAIELGYSFEEIQNWPPLVHLLQDLRFKTFMETKPREGLTVPTSNK